MSEARRLFGDGAIVLTVLVFFLLACADQTSQEHYAQGMARMAENDAVSAVIHFKNALERDPVFYDARVQLARAYRLAGNPEAARREFQKASRQRPDDAKVLLELARVSVELDRPTEALDALDGVQDALPDRRADVIELIGMSHALLGRHELARTELEETYRLNGGTPRTALALARVLLELERPDEARHYVEEVLDAEHEHLGAWFALAQIEAAEGHTDKAFSAYDALLEQSPGNSTALLGKGMLLIGLGRHEEAEAIAGEMLKAAPGRPEGHALRGRALLQAGKYDEAIVSFQKVLALRPSAADYYYLGLSHYRAGETEQALSQFQRALDLNPSLNRARVLTALVLLRSGQEEDAMTELKRALDAKENDAMAHSVLGGIYLSRGFHDDASQELERALELDPGLADARLKLGLLSLKEDRPEDAESDLRAAVAAAPSMAGLRLVLATYYRDRGKYGDALQVLDSGLTGSKADGRLLNLKADVLLQQGDQRGAIAALERATSLDPTSLLSHFNLAAVYFMSGDPERGMAQYRTVLKRDPANLQAILELASALEVQGRLKDARNQYQEAARVDGSTGTAELARYHLRHGEPAEALRVIEEALSAGSDPRLVSLKGQILKDQGMFAEAVEAFEILAREEPEEALSRIIVAYLEMGKPERALARVRTEMEARPERLELSRDVSRLLMAMGRRDEAIANAEQTIQQHPESPVGYMSLAGIRYGENDVEDATDLLVEATRRANPSSRLHVMLGDFYALQNVNKSALEHYRKAISLAPDSPEARFKEASVLYVTGQRTEAARSYAQVLRLDGNHVEALNSLAYLEAQDHSQMNRALQLAMRAYLLAPSDGYVLDTLGYVFLKTGDLQRSVSLLQEAVEKLPRNASVHYHLALALEATNRKAEAAGALRQALSLGDFPERDVARRRLNQLERG